jgi:hypothetical protein
VVSTQSTTRYKTAIFFFFFFFCEERWTLLAARINKGEQTTCDGVGGGASGDADAEA